MIENRFDDVRLYADVGQASRNAATNVVHAPGRDRIAKLGIERDLAFVPGIETIGAARAEQIIAPQHP
jgi:hypothetical protein